MARQKLGASQGVRFGAARGAKQEICPWELRKRNIGKWASCHSEQRRSEVDESEWKVHINQEGKLMGLKKHRLLYGGEGEQN